MPGATMMSKALLRSVAVAISELAERPICWSNAALGAEVLADLTGARYLLVGGGCTWLRPLPVEATGRVSFEAENYHAWVSIETAGVIDFTTSPLEAVLVAHLARHGQVLECPLAPFLYFPTPADAAKSQLYYTEIPRITDEVRRVAQMDSNVARRVRAKALVCERVRRELGEG